GEIRPLAAPPERVKGLRDQLLPHTGFTDDERVVHVRRQPAQLTEYFLHRRAPAHHPAERERWPRQLMIRFDLRAIVTGAREPNAQHLVEVTQLEWLGDVVECAKLHRLYRGFNRRVAAH